MSRVERKVEVSNLEQKNIDSEETTNNKKHTAEESTEAKNSADASEPVKKVDEEENTSAAAGSKETESSEGDKEQPEVKKEEAENAQTKQGGSEDADQQEGRNTAEEQNEAADQVEGVEQDQETDDLKSAEKDEPEVKKEEKAKAGNEKELSKKAAQEPENTAEGADTDQPEVKKEAAAQSGTAEGDDESTDESTIEYYKDIVERAKDLVEQTDWSYVSAEMGVLAQNVSEGPEISEGETKNLIEEFEKLRSNFEEKKKAHYEELNRKKEENLAKKKELLKSLSEIVSEENWTATKEVGQIKGKWENIKLLPQGEAETLNERFNNLMQEFEDHKVDRLVKKLQQEEENLELKLLLLDKMEALNEKLKDENADFESLNKDFDSLLSQWRKVGRVPAEKNQELWDRFNAAQDAFNEIRFKYDKKYREEIEKALSKKKKLVKEAEALVDQENIAKAARKVNKLHKAWKKAGNLPQKEENEMWDMFKAATDAFNEKKSENIELLREQEEENLEKKYDLIKKAEETKGTDDFEAGHSTMQNLMSQWKKIGPVPRKKSSKIWKKFKGAMDEFYDRRRENFKEQRQDQKENLKKKQEILDKLKELGSHDDPALAVEEAKKLQSQFKDIGHVPIKMKNKVWKQYREACDVIYDRYRALGSDLGMEKKLAKEGVDPDSRKEIIKYQKEVSQLKKDVSRLESEIIQYEEAQTYFKPTNKGNVLKEELQEKIDKAEAAIEEKQNRLYELDRKIDELKDDEN